MKEMIYVKKNRQAAVYMASVWVRNMPSHMRQHIELQPAAEQLPPTIVSDPNIFCDDPSLKSLGLALWLQQLHHEGLRRGLHWIQVLCAGGIW